MISAYDELNATQSGMTKIDDNAFVGHSTHTSLNMTNECYYQWLLLGVSLVFVTNGSPAVRFVNQMTDALQQGAFARSS
jgi:hypothetical protein